MKARQQAYNILLNVCLEGAYANLSLRNIQEHVPYTTKVVYGTLQHHLHLKYIVEKHTKTKQKITLLLMMATYELLWMDSPRYAIIHEFVEISKTIHQGKYTKLVNAVLRKIQAVDKIVNVEDELEKLSIETSHPLWLIKMWNKQYGEERCREICFANLEEKIQYIRKHPSLTEMELLKNPHIQKNELGYFYTKGNASQDPLYLEGKISIQDFASQKVSLFLNPQPTDAIIDICAAPGSKTLHIAELCNDQAEIVALDLYESRVQLIQDACKRLNMHSIKTVVADAITYTSTMQYDKVLVDAVCSGYGVLKGKSDIKYHMHSNDMDEIISIQKAILQNSSRLVKVNGELVYSTCTLNKKENENQIQTFLDENPCFELVDEQTIFPFSCDGFYMAKLRRVS